MSDTFSAFNATSHPIVKLADDWNNLVSHGLTKISNHTIKVNGSYYEALSGSTGQLVYGGADNKGGVDGTDAQAVIQAAWDQLGLTFIKKGTYSIDSELVAKSNMSCLLENGATIQVPEGYVGNAVAVYDGITNFKLYGEGTINEAGTPAKDWNAIKIYATTGGVYFNHFEGFRIQNANIAFKFLVDSAAGWVNGNSFQNLTITYPNIFFDFDLDTAYIASTNGFNRNYFANIVGQSHPTDTTYGAKNVQNIQNVFIDVKFWDLPAGAVSASISSDATYTTILGGIMTNNNYTDSGTDTFVVDQWNKSFTGTYNIDTLKVDAIRPQDGAYAIRAIPTEDGSWDFQLFPYDASDGVSISLYGYGSTERLAFRKNASTRYELDVTKQTAGGAFLPLYFRTNDVTTSTITNVAYIDTDSNFKIEQLKIPTSVSATPVSGSMYVDTATNKLYVRCGATWRFVTLGV